MVYHPEKQKLSFSRSISIVIGKLLHDINENKADGTLKKQNYTKQF